MAKLFANSGDPDQMLHSVVSDLGLLCLAITILWVSRLKLFKMLIFCFFFCFLTDLFTTEG